jgi:hypothetical protein
MTEAQLSGWLLIGAAVASLAAATMPSLARSSVWMLPAPEYFRVIRAHEMQWRAHGWLFAVGAVLMGVGLAFAAQGIPSRYAIAALILYLLVAPAWLAHLAFRLDLTAGAAHDERLRPVFEQLGPWTGSLYNVFMIGSYFAIALLGAALLDRPLVPQWTAWVLVIFGGVAGVSHWVARPNLMGMRSPFDLPVLVQLAPLFVAIPLAAGQL